MSKIKIIKFEGIIHRNPPNIYKGTATLELVQQFFLIYKIFKRSKDKKIK